MCHKKNASHDLSFNNLYLLRTSAMFKQVWHCSRFVVGWALLRGLARTDGTKVRHLFGLCKAFGRKVWKWRGFLTDVGQGRGKGPDLPRVSLRFYHGLCARCPFRALLLIFAHQTVHRNTFSWHLHCYRWRVYFLFIALKRMELSERKWWRASGFVVKSLLL